MSPFQREGSSRCLCLCKRRYCFYYLFHTKILSDYLFLCKLFASFQQSFLYFFLPLGQADQSLFTLELVVNMPACVFLLPDRHFRKPTYTRKGEMNCTTL